jgi:uncharacterized membrane protein YgdD (TMEM256/DUF423 family)
MSESTVSEPSLSRFGIVTGSVLMVLAIVLGAFGTHLLQDRLDPARLVSFRSGVLYHQLHAIGLVLLGVIAAVSGESSALRWSARLMLVGVLLFSGSIYLLTAGFPRSLGMVAPIGGFSFMAAWLLLGVHGWRMRSQPDSGST